MYLATPWDWDVKDSKITDKILSPTENTALALSFAKMVTTTRFLEMFGNHILSRTGKRSEVIDKMVEMRDALTKKSWAEYLEGQSDK